MCGVCVSHMCVREINKWLGASIYGFKLTTLHCVSYIVDKNFNFIPCRILSISL